MSKRSVLTIILAIIGLALIAVAIVYFVEPASSLPHWVPGYIADSDYHHWKHGTLAAVIGVLFLVGAWFWSARSAKK
jgi:uncharacterized membrane protein YphA (DoxX/SURF4 family)